MHQYGQSSQPDKPPNVLPKGYKSGCRFHRLEGKQFPNHVPRNVTGFGVELSLTWELIDKMGVRRAPV